MNRGGAMPKTNPTGWVYLRSGDCTIRWQRGGKVAHVFSGNQVNKNPARAEAIAIFPVSAQGWTDLAAVKLAGETWVKEHRQRCQACGVIS